MWDESDDEEEEEDPDGYDSDQQQALYYKNTSIEELLGEDKESNKDSTSITSERN